MESWLMHINMLVSEILWMFYMLQLNYLALLTMHGSLVSNEYEKNTVKDVLINELINSVRHLKAKICIYHTLSLISLYLLEHFPLKIDCQGDSKHKY